MADPEYIPHGKKGTLNGEFSNSNTVNTYKQCSLKPTPKRLTLEPVARGKKALNMQRSFRENTQHSDLPYPRSDT